MDQFKLPLAFLYFFSLAFTSFTQGIPKGNVCGTVPAVEDLMRHNPDYAQQVNGQESRNRNITANLNYRLPESTTKVIPIVVHIVHDNTSANISREQVMDAVRIINEDFNYLNPDTADVIQPFKNRVANVQVEFRLARLDPDGNCTDGITRTYSTLTNAAGNAVMDLVRWDTNKYLNIWVVNNISSGVGGYTYYPCPNPLYDGIMIHNYLFGTIGTASPLLFSRTLTHEIGHYLDLPHIWGNTNTPGLALNCNTDDGISDTPNTIGTVNYECNTAAATCGTLNNVQNIMDYSGCQLMFTHGQKAVMQNTLESAPCRTNLWSQTNRMATGTTDGYPVTVCAPQVYFFASTKKICEGNSVQFSDFSYNSILDSTWSWSWSFPGGTPNTSTAKNPLIVYNTAGIYPVTLEVTNAAGANTLTQNSFVEVNTLNSGLVAPLMEGFENPLFPVSGSGQAQDWVIEAGSNTTWEHTSSAAATGNYALRIQQEFTNEAGELNSLISPGIEVNATGQKLLQFKIAYAPATVPTPDPDRLKVYVSTNCGQTWNLRYAKSGAALQTAPAVNGQFIPQMPAHWRQESVTIPAGQQFLQIKFESTSGLNSTLYLDDINLVNGLVGMGEEGDLTGLTVIPNPNHGQALISYELAQAGTTTLTLTNNLGQEVVNVSRFEQAGKQEHQLGTLSEKLAAGLYFIRLQTADKVSIQKVVIR